MAGYIPRRFICPQAVTHLSSNRIQCRLTTLIETNVLTTTHCYVPPVTACTSDSDNWQTLCALQIFVLCSIVQFVLTSIKAIKTNYMQLINNISKVPKYQKIIKNGTLTNNCWEGGKTNIPTLGLTSCEHSVISLLSASLFISISLSPRHISSYAT